MGPTKEEKRAVCIANQLIFLLHGTASTPALYQKYWQPNPQSEKGRRSVHVGLGPTAQIRLTNIKYGLNIFTRFVTGKSSTANRLGDLLRVPAMSIFFGFNTWVNCKVY